MIRDVNDQPWRADLLGRLLAGKLAHVNLIPLNPTPGIALGREPEAGGAGVCPAAARRRRADYGPGHPWAGDRRCVWAARRFADARWLRLGRGRKAEQ